MKHLTLTINTNFIKAKDLIDLNSRVFFIGSCFSENISMLLKQRKFLVTSNPYGILFDVLSIERCIEDIVLEKKYAEKDIFLYKELNGSWNHHTSFSDTNINTVLDRINHSISNSHNDLLHATHIAITLGSAFSYYHINEKKWVANCHKVPQTEFEKKLITSNKIFESLENIRTLILKVNPNIQFILTISPVRHLRDGVIENNRSKAQLIEATHRFIEKYPDAYYFPSYEIMIDVLRDYRFYDIDYAHPNYQATEIVFEYFKKLCINPLDYDKMEDFYKLYIAKNHIPKHPSTMEHEAFLKHHLSLSKKFQAENPNLDFSEEIMHFQSKN